MRQAIYIITLLALLAPMDWVRSDLDSPHVNSAGVHHGEDHSCPDQNADGTPCSDQCPCSCCPGHASTALFVYAVQIPLDLNYVLMDFSPSEPSAHFEFLHCIFHPPQA